MIFRQATLEERQLLLEHGYKEWSKNRTFEKYCIDNTKEDAFGTRYVIDVDDHITSSNILMKLRSIIGKHVYGIGSVVTPEEYRGHGYAAELLRRTIELVSRKDSMLLLYSDIDPAFYEKLGFRILPKHLQRYEKSVYMVHCEEAVWNEFIKCDVKELPEYF